MLQHYLSTAARHFRRHKVSTVINVGCLAAGLLCFMFTLGAVNYLTASDSFHANASRTLVVTTQLSRDGQPVFPTGSRTSFSVAKYLRAQVPPSALVARASTFNEQTSLAAGAEKRAIRASYADPGFTRIFDLDFIAGDRVSALEKPNSVVLTADLAGQLFGSTDVVGRSLLLNGRQNLYVTGVIEAPRQPSHMSATDTNAGLQFQALISMDVHEAAIPLQEAPDMAAVRLNRPYGFMWYHTYVLLPSDGSYTRAMLDAALSRIARDHSGADLTLTLATDAMTAIRVITMNALMETAGSGLSASGLLLLLGTLVVVVASLNYANLATAQAATRIKEVAMRQVVGATRIDLVLQYLFEAFLLTTCALLCMLGLALLLRVVLAGPLHTGVEILLFGAGSLRFWIITFGIVATVSVLAGLYPALGTMRIRPAQAVKTSRSGRGSTWVSSLFVGVQFFAASFLLIAVLVMSKQNEVVQRNAYALTPDPVIAITNDFRKSGIDLAAFKAALANRSEIKSVTASMFPLGIAPNDNAPIAETPDPLARKLTVSVQLIDYDFFETLGVDVRAGRTFDRQYGDDISDAERERAGNIVIDLALVRRLGWASAEDALGKVLYVPGIANGLARKPGPSTIVGVVEDKPLYAINFSRGEGSIYQLVPRLAAYPMVRVSRGDMRAARAAVEDAWDRVAPGIALQASFLDEQFERGLYIFRLIAGIFSFLAMFSICIASVGLIGMATHMASRRTHEIGVRKTLGASVTGILRMLLTDFSKPVVIANLLAWPLGFIAARLYLNLFVERAPQTLLPYIASMLFTLIVVWAAVAAPAIRAARVRPAGVLRYE